MTIIFPPWAPRFIKVTLPLVIGLTFILSTGPQVQGYLVSFLNSTVPSVYGSAYKDQLIAFPTLGQWAKDAFYWPFVSMAVMIVLIAIRDQKPITLLWRIGVVSFIVLSVFDAGFCIYQSNLTIKSATENIIGNFVGSLIISSLVVLIISLADFLYSNVPAKAVTKNFAAGVSVIITGFMFLVTIYYLADLFYNPLSVRLETHLASPVSGAIIFKEKNTSKESGEEISSEKSNQSLVPIKAIHSHASWNTAEGQQKIAFRSLSPGTRYEASITFLSGWCNSEKIGKLSAIEPSLKISDIEKGDISFDEGVSMLEIFLSDSAEYEFSAVIKDLSVFWFGQDSGSKDTHLTHFLNKTDSVKLVASHKENTFLLSAPLIVSKGGKSKFAPRILTAKLGTSAYSMRFVPSKKLRSDEVSDCKIVPAADIEKSDKAGFLSANGLGAVSNVLVKIRQDEDPQTLSAEDTELLVSGGGGWFKIDPMKAEDFEGHRAGTLELLQVRGNISELALDGQAIAARPLSTYTAIGEFTAAYGTGGTLMVSGLAKSLWKDNGRLNMTKWEKLAWEPMVFILGLLGAVIAWISTRLAKCLRTNAPFSWLS